MMLSVEVPPLGFSETSVRLYLILYIRKLSLIWCRIIMDIYALNFEEFEEVEDAIGLCLSVRACVAESHFAYGQELLEIGS